MVNATYLQMQAARTTDDDADDLVKNNYNLEPPMLRRVFLQHERVAVLKALGTWTTASRDFFARRSFESWISLYYTGDVALKHMANTCSQIIC